VLILVGASGFDYEEVSRILACPLGTVKSRLARARKGLERVLQEWETTAEEAEPELGVAPRRMPSEEIH
jgi:RNA polymerase sigma-70 factor (ECF subfamily)